MWHIMYNVHTCTVHVHSAEESPLSRNPSFFSTAPLVQSDYIVHAHVHVHILLHMALHGFTMC